MRPEHEPGFGAKLRAVFGLSPTILCLTGLEDGRVRDVNDSFLATTGFTRDEVIGRPMAELGLWLNPEDRAEGLRKLRAGEAIRGLEARFRMKDGESRVTMLSADVLTIDGEACILTALTDITDRKRAEEALRESERLFMTAFHANPLPMSIRALSDHHPLEVNEAAVRHSGYSREELLGRSQRAPDFGVAPEQQERMLRLLHERGQVRDLEVTLRTRAGDLRHFVVNSEVITYGGAPAVLSVSHDITERKQLEAESRARRDEAEALAQSLREADRAKDEFLAMLGHELRNPLGTLTNAVAVLNKMTGDETTRHLLAIVSRQTGHLARLVDDLLDVGRVTTGKIELHMRRVELRALVGRCLDSIVQAGRTQRHRVALQGVDLHVQADVTRLEQIVNNLLDNALKYTPAPGSVTVETSQDAGWAVLRVRDTGKGIAVDLLPRVFDLFVQEPQTLDRSRGGLGIGLALVKRLVDLHGGTVSAWSAGPGQGSEFTVRLPIREQPPDAPDAADQAAAPAKPPRRRVLVVEDSPDARESLQMLLELAGHVVETSEDGSSGLAKLDQFRPEVALIDLGLPGIDGYTLARRARENPETRAIRLVAVTGYGQAEDRQRALAAGFDFHVTKPVDAAMLEELLGRPR